MRFLKLLILSMNSMSYLEEGRGQRSRVESPIKQEVQIMNGEGESGEGVGPLLGLRRIVLQAPLDLAEAKA